MFSVYDFFNVYTVIGCAFVFLWYFSRSTYGYWRQLNVKYLQPVPFFGNTFRILFRITPAYQEYDRFYKALYDEPLGGIFVLRKPQLIVKDPQLVSAILIKDFIHFHDRGRKQLSHTCRELDPLAANLLFASGERWKFLRQNLSTVFSPGKLKCMHEQISDCVDLLIEYIDQQMDGNDSVDAGLKDLFERSTINWIGSCAFGIDCKSLKSNDEFGKMCRRTVRPGIIVAVRALLAEFSPRLLHFFKWPENDKRVTDFFLKLTRDMIEYRRQNGASRNDLLQLLMELQNSHEDPKFAVISGQNKKVLGNEKFDEIDIAANAFIFFFSGFETTASALSYCLYELALNQNIQEKLRTEVRHVSCGSPLTYESLEQLKYMDAVISETYRMYPAAPILHRECTKDYAIPGTNIQIPAGTLVAIPVWSIHHDSRYYSNSEVFNPDRFVGDKKYSQPKGTFLPYGDGPKHCLGKRFAEIEIKATLSKVLLKYNVEPCAKTEIPLKFKNGSTMLKSTCGVWVNLSKRQD